MERKIGETFEYQGKTYKVAEFDDCRNCAFIHINCSSLRSITGSCMYFLRNDGVSVKFEEVKDMEIKDNQLTPAILERNGWDKEGKDGSVFSLSEEFMGGDKDDEDNYTCFQLYYQNKEDGWDIDMRGEPLKYEIHYVHELQHLFFGLGLDSSMIV